MKIPSPQELQQQVNAELGPIADAKVAEIVAGMKKCSYRPISVDVSVPSNVQGMVRQRFADAGWNVAFMDDQRDGASVRLTPATTASTGDQI
jgi:hypothetical protein